MSRKRIEKRLNELFTDIRKAEDASAPEAASKKPRRTTSQTKVEATGPAVTQSQPPPAPKAGTAKAPLPTTGSLRLPVRFEPPVETLTDTDSGIPTTTMALPFRVDSDNWGILQIANPPQERPWSGEEQQLVKQVVDQLSLALENARLFQQTQVRAEELAVLNEMGRALTSSLNFDSIIENTHRFATRLIDSRNFYIAIHNPDNDEVSFPLAYEHGEQTSFPPRRSGTGMTEYILRNGLPLLLESDVERHIRELGMDILGEIPQSWLGVPMIAGGRTTGVIVVQDYDQPNAFDQNALNLLTAVASQAAIALQNANLIEETRQRNEQLSALNQIISAASQTLDLKSILSDVLRRILETVGLDAGLVSMYNSATGQLEIGVTLGLPDTMIRNFEQQGLSGTLCEAVYNVQDAIIIDDLRRGAPLDVSGLIANGLVSYLGVPLEARGEVLGTLCTFKKIPLDIHPSTVELMRSIGRQIAFAVENANLFQEAQDNALTTQRRSEELSTLNELGQALASELGLEQILKETFRGVSRLIDTTNFFIGLYDPAKEQIEFRLNVTESAIDQKIVTLPADRGITGYIIRTRETVLIKEDVVGWNEAHGLPNIGEPAMSWLGVPITLGAQVLGAMAVQNYREKSAYDEHDRDILVAISNQAAIAIQNALLFQETRTRADEQAILNQLGRELAATLEVGALGEAIHRHTSRLMDTRNFSFVQFDPVQQLLTYPYATIDGERIQAEARKLANGLTDYIIGHKEPLFIPEDLPAALQHMEVDSIPIGSEPPAMCWMGAPLLVGAEILGVIVVQSAETANLYSEHQRDLLLAIANQASLALQNAISFQTTQQRADEIALLNQVMANVSGFLDLETSMELVAEEITNRFHVSHVGIAITNLEKTGVVVVADSSSFGEHPAGQGSFLPIGRESALGQVFNTRKALFIPNVPENSLLESERGALATASARSTYIVPLLLGKEVLGIMNLDFREEGRTPTEREIRLLETISLQVATAVQKDRLFQQIQASESRFRDVAFTSADYVWETDLEWKYTYLSERVKDVLGYTPEELVGKSAADVSSPEESGRMKQELLSQIESRSQATDLENVLISKDGKPVTVLTSAVQIRDNFERAIGYRGIDKDITAQKSAEKVRTAIQSISESALAAPDMQSLLRGVHEAVNNLMPARNFYVALYDERSDLMNFPYYVDQFDTLQPPQKPGKSLTSYVLRSGKPLLATPDTYKQLVDAGEVTLTGTDSIDWLGVPLRSGNRVIGVIAVQTYEETTRLALSDRDTLAFVANQVAVAVERKQSELELRALFISMTDIILVLDKDGRYLRIAPTNPSHLYKPSEELLGRRVGDLLPADTADLFLKAIHQALESGQTTKIEYPLEASGQQFWFDASISPLTEDQVFWVARDITERKDFEETLRRQNEYLASSSEIGRLITSTLDLDQLFKQTVNLIRDRFGFYHAAIFIIEETGFNAVLQAATGEAGAEMKRRGHMLPLSSRSIVGSVSSSGSPLVVNNTAVDSNHRPNPLLPDTRAEAAIPLRVGRRIIGAIDIQSDEVDAFTQDEVQILQSLADQVAIAIDNARSYELAQKAVQEMRELDRIKSQFLANMSHELRTPLNSIIGFSRVILKGIDGPVSDLQQQDLNAIYNSGQHLLRLINDILDLSKIEAGKMELAFDEVNVGDTINSVVPTITGLIKDKPIKLKKNIPTDLPIIRADPMRLRQVLINLLSNAAKFTDEGTINVEAGVKPSADGQMEIVVSVSDTGPGIAPEDQAKLFQPFSQVDASPTRKTGGTGLGLSISRHLVDMHGGRIGIHSSAGKGSTFYFTLPIPHEKSAGAPAVPASGGRIILAIEDDLQVVSLYERYLQPQGYQVVSLTDPSLAKERIKQLKPYAITLDIMMPGRDGWSVLNDLKTDAETRDIPVIICSILEEEEKGFSLGASDYLVKPVLEAELLNSLNRLNSDGSIEDVLVIDDDPKDLRLIGRILNQDNRYRAILAQGGAQGWEVLASNPPHAVILDLFMPDLDGFEILQKLKANPRLRDIPVIVVSGADLTPAQKQRLADFGQVLLQKATITEKELLSVLDKALTRLRAR
ncbi:MAG: GAF domain-containing protein [Chloroflexi bacterium]|nr:GAF domain-containing protein [Chloroflexota bacterium]